MGVPKFYRWLSERYACLSQVIKDHQIPEFDNLYLDMNGIIHPCSHPNDDDPHFRITEEEIFLNIFHYIEVLFRIIKPQKVFFMAVDGVAPRAKMNQQRSRRFRSAREAEENIRKALQKGEILPTEDRFDSNCITPGTEFMVRLHEQLKYFVNKKISTDPGWQGINIYLSGHETPGEGEHKIMDYIRYERSQPGYDPNTRHCLYGLDADLIMLGLTSHDPHFSLLREEVRFGKKVKRINKPENITFHLLHLSLLREYIDWEFEALKSKISCGYDLEKIIDDWILMGFLVGNDFIPNLPNFHINHDALPYLWQVYKDVMPSLGGYLHDGGILCLENFEVYLKRLAKFDLEKFEDAYVDLKWLEGKSGKTEDEDSLDFFEQDEVDSACDGLDKIALGSSKKSTKLRDYLSEKGVLEEAEAEDDGDFTVEHERYKLKYYVEKFELQSDTESELTRQFVEELSLKYVEAIQWILHYYFNGISSWGWYFPYHYAPYVSDITDFKDVPITFDIGTPFLPFEQLLAVLPAASKKLLPAPFQNLMIMQHSPIIDYYPLEFKTDLNGKRQDWEAVVLIPFIDEERLLDAMTPLYDRLNNHEKTRNRHSPCLLYNYDKDKSEKYPSSLPDKFPDLECSHASSQVIPIDKYRLTPEQITKGLLPDVKLDVYFPGFPTLKHISHSGELRKVGVKVFQMHSRGESIVLSIDESDEPNVKDLVDSLLGQVCYVGWPHLVEAFVTSVSDGKTKFMLSKDSPEKVHEATLTAKDISAWKKQASCEKHAYLERKAVDTGMVHVLIEACQIQGKKYVCDGKSNVVQLEKVWSEWAVAFPLQVTVKDLSVCDETDGSAPVFSNVTELFPVDTECFMMAIPHYGSSGKVIEVDSKQNRVRVQLSVVPEPDLVSLILNQDDYTDLYMPARIVAKRLAIPSHVLSQITGKVFLCRGDKETSGKIDIGLNLKFSKQNKEVLGFARRFGGEWTYSTKTEQIISQYQEKFPQVFDVLSKSSPPDTHKVADVFPDNNQSGALSSVQNWLKTLSSHNQKAVSCGSSTLDEPIIQKIEDTVSKLKDEKQTKKSVKVRVKPTVLYRPMKHMGQVPPDPAAEFELFDRVVNVRPLGVAPYGLKGTIVGIHQGQSEKKEVSYEVLFDEPFMGGQSLRGSFENKLFVMPPWSLLNLSHGNRLELRKKGLLSPQQQHQRNSAAKLLEGSPAGYNPSGRAGSRHHVDGAWQTSPHHGGSPRGNFGSPRGNFGSPRGGFGSPRGGFGSPRGGSGSPRDTFSSPRGGPSPRARFSPHDGPSRTQAPFQPRILQSPRSNQNSQDSPTSAARTSNSAQESERVIRELLRMNTPPSEQQQQQQQQPATTTGNPLLNTPQAMFNNSDYSRTPISPTSPSAANVPSGLLVLACRQNNWPQPTFSHHRLPQGLITTVCVAGKLFQGSPSSNIVESSESAAHMALVAFGLLPPPFPFPASPLMNPFFPGSNMMSPSRAPVPRANTARHSRTPAARFHSPQTSQKQKGPPTQGTALSRPASDKKDGKVKDVENTRDKKDEKDKDAENAREKKDGNDESAENTHDKKDGKVGSAENAQITKPADKDQSEPKSDTSPGQRKDMFIPHQVSLNKAVDTKGKDDQQETAQVTQVDKVILLTPSSASDVTTTPKSAKPKEQRLLAPSFFSSAPPSQ